MSKFNIATKTLLLLLAFCVCFPAFSPEAGAYDVDIQCESSSKAYAVYLYCIEEDEVLFDKNSDKKISPASTVKLMTALVAFDMLKDINATVTITSEMLGDVKSNIMKLEVGENIKIKDIFAGLVCSGYNDAANALAVIAGGSVSRFVELMNEKAASLGAFDTVFVDPMGIDDAAQTTASDVMKIAKEFMSRELLMELSSSPSYEVSATNFSGARTIYNRNAMIYNRSTSKYLDSNACGMNAGMTSGGGYCVVTSTQKDDRTYICVVMGASYDDDTDTVYSYVVASELLRYVKKNLGYRTIVEAGYDIRSLDVVGASIKIDSVSVSAAEDIKIYLPANYDDGDRMKVSYVYYSEELIAPIAKGDVVGRIIVSYDNEIIAVSDIVVNEDIERDNFMYMLAMTKNFAYSRGLVAAVVCFVLLLTAYVFIYPRIRQKRRKRRSVSQYRYK